MCKHCLELLCYLMNKEQTVATKAQSHGHGRMTAIYTPFYEKTQNSFSNIPIIYFWFFNSNLKQYFNLDYSQLYLWKVSQWCASTVMYIWSVLYIFSPSFIHAISGSLNPSKAQPRRATLPWVTVMFEGFLVNRRPGKTHSLRCS